MEDDILPGKCLRHLIFLLVCIWSLPWSHESLEVAIGLNIEWNSIVINSPSVHEVNICKCSNTSYFFCRIFKWESFQWVLTSMAVSAAQPVIDGNIGPSNTAQTSLTYRRWREIKEFLGRSLVCGIWRW